MSLSAPAGAQSIVVIMPMPTDVATGNVHFSSHANLFDVGSHLLARLRNSFGTWRTAAINFNPLGGGDYEDPASGPIYRAWLEGYGLRSHTDASGPNPGDKRTTWGGVAGLATSLPSGLSFGATVDQSRSDVSVVGLPQNGRLDMTQLAAVVSYSSGPWTFGLGGVYGTGTVDTRRTDAGGIAVASYGAQLWALLAELSYYWQSGLWRAVPKVGIDWMRTSTAAFTETGGAAPVSGTARSTERARAFIGGEIGYSWFVGERLHDLSVSARAIEILSQQVDPLQVSAAGFLPQVVQASKESRFGVEVGATALMQLTSAVTVYAAYDGRFRSDFRSHAGTLGADVRW